MTQRFVVVMREETSISGEKTRGKGKGAARFRRHRTYGWSALLAPLAIISPLGRPMVPCLRWAARVVTLPYEKAPRYRIGSCPGRRHRISCISLTRSRRPGWDADTVVDPHIDGDIDSNPNGIRHRYISSDANSSALARSHGVAHSGADIHGRADCHGGGHAATASHCDGSCDSDRREVGHPVTPQPA